MLAIVAVTRGAHDSLFAPLVGRGHAVMVHLPIGVLLASVVFDWLVAQPLHEHEGRSDGLSAAGILRLLGAWSAIAAAIAGVLLADWGSYAPETLFLHRALGVLTALAAVAWFVVRDGLRHPIRHRTTFVRGGAAAMAALLVMSGHLGGTLVRGDDYLTRYLPQPVRDLARLPDSERLTHRRLANAAASPVFDSIVQPLLMQRCASCHDGTRKLGGLDLTSAEGVSEGGREGKVVVPGRADESEMVLRLELPPGHMDAMPPDRAIPASEIALLRWWIDQGASATITLADIARPSGVRRTLAAYGLDDVPAGVYALTLPEPDSVAIVAASDAGLTVQRVARRSSLLRVHAINVPSTWQEASLASLRPLARHIVDLSLTRTPSSDSALALLAEMPNLTHVGLAHSRVSDAGLQHLRELQHLEVLNLVGTDVSDAGLRTLETLPRLRAVYLGETRTTSAGVARLRRAHPRARIIRDAAALVTPPGSDAVAADSRRKGAP
ncbi:MAG: c-type cytochrome domain-containing protein [Gemmatimonadaceae bacterium]